MNKMEQSTVKKICEDNRNDSTRMMDIVKAVQNEIGYVDDETIDLIAEQVNTPRVKIEGVVSFYAFLSKKPKGKIIIRVCDDVVDKMKGAHEVASAFCDELGIKMGETTSDGLFSLELTPCIGMSDQAPAALINDTVVPELTASKVKEIVSELKEKQDPLKLSLKNGDGNNDHELMRSAVKNNIFRKGPVIFTDFEQGAGLKKALSLTPEEVVETVKASNLRGRGGAGFPTGMKWEFTRAAKGEQKIIICNADEGEPGTFKDRTLLTEVPELMIEGMSIAGYAIGANEGIIYLRGEYAYLKAFLENALKSAREKNLLGENILGKNGFNFDIRIQMGAGAYICGEESALISSCEGLRGDPKTRPPFPAQKGYKENPTSVNNVETFCCVSRILDIGVDKFAEIGTEKSKGTKLLSISGDCKKPGVYEYPFGVTIEELLEETGAEDTQAVLVGGPSGQFIASDSFKRKICFSDLCTGGSIVIFNDKRDMLKIAYEYMAFFEEESCGYCTPCRVGNVLLKRRLEKIIEGKGEPKDLDYLNELGESIRYTSRCGMGQTSPNPVLTTLKNFRAHYEKLIKEAKDGMQPDFNIKDALSVSESLIGRKSVIY